MKTPPKPPTIQSVVDNFAKNYSPFLRVMMLPAMVERWAREAYELALRHRSERNPQDSTVEPSPEKGGLSL